MRLLHYRTLILYFPLLVSSFAAYSQNTRTLVGTCEGCEAIFEYGDRKLSATTSLPEYQMWGEPLKISGKIYKADGKTPAPGVILYVYLTNNEGVYPKKGDEKGWARRHGYLRAWIKSDEEGNYTFFTNRPATYPSRTEAAHIHLTILEPDGKYYWVDSYYFEDDPLLTEKERNKNTRGGNSGILSLRKDSGLMYGRRNITLGKNIPGYH